MSTPTVPEYDPEKCATLIAAIAANVSDSYVTDHAFRAFIRNSIKTVVKPKEIS